MADKDPGLMFQNYWTGAIPSMPSGGGGGLLGLLGAALLGGEEEKEPTNALGQGFSLPKVPGGVGINPQATGGPGLAPFAGAMPMKQLAPIPPYQSPSIPKPSTTVPAGQDLDGDGIIDNFWKR